MPRAPITNRELWIAELRRGQADAAQRTDRRVLAWSLIVLMATVLYAMIGHSPYSRGVILDEATGSVEISPINRYVWILLAGACGPILLARRRLLIDAAKRLWPLLLLYVWFAMTTRWALDPGTSSRRFFLYVIALVISVSLAVGFNDGRRFFRAMAIACGTMVIIDVLSWIAMPGVSMTPLGLAAIHNHKNTLGAVMLFCSLILGPYVFTQKTAKGRWWWGALFFFAFVLLVASKSKTSLAIFVGVAAATPLLLGALSLRVKTLLGVAAALLLLLFGALLLWLAWCTTMGLNPLGPLLGLTFTQRTDVWAFVIDQILQRPFAGAGFASFWDIDPALQPSLQTDLWFSRADAFTNEAHNGYLDLLVTTGLAGMLGAVAVLLRWVVRGMAQMRQTLRSADYRDRENLPQAVALGLFPFIMLGHNFMESSYFTANSLFGTLILIVGVELDVRYRRTAPAPAPPIPAARRRVVRNNMAMTPISRT